MFNLFRRKKKKLDARSAVHSAFSQALGIDDIDETANFFELGGDSMMATVVTAALDEMGHTVPSTAVFDYPTAQSLIAHISGGHTHDGFAIASVEVGRRNPSEPTRLRASLLQERLWPFERNPDPKRFQLRSEGAVMLHGAFDAEILQQALNLLAQRQEVLRSAFEETDDGLLAVIFPQAHVSLELFSATGLEDARLIVERFTRQVFDLADPPPMRAALIALPHARHVLTVSMHHIVSDGWSMGVFVGELAALYSALRRDMHPQLPELPFQFADYAVSHRAWLASRNGQQAVTFWRDYLSGLQPGLEIALPNDQPRQAAYNFPVRRQFLPLEAATQSNLRSLARATQSSVATVFLGAFLTVYAALTRAEDVPIGIMHANRNLPGTQNLIGFFATLVTLRFGLPKTELSLTQAIELARQESRKVDPYASVPIGTLLDAGIIDTLPRIFVDSVPRAALPDIDGVSVEDFPFEHPPLFLAADVALFLFDIGSALSCILGTNRDMFSDDAAARLADLLGSALADIPPT
jgi:acyl carrier protein